MGAKHQKLFLGNNAPGKCLHAHIQHFFSPSPANEEKFAESAFFHTRIKHLSWSRWIYELIEAKHQTLLSGNNSPGKCLQAHMQHFFSPSPAIEKKFAESAFFSYKNQKLVMKPLNLRANGGKTPKTTPGQQCPGKCLQAHMQHFFSPSPAIEKKFAESAFFHTKKQKLVMKPLNLRANGGKTPKTTPGQQCPRQVPSRPHATFLQP